MSRLLNIEETKITILKWISKCTNQEQLSLCREIIDNFVVKRFKHYVPFKDLAVALAELDNAIEEQRTKIICGMLELETQTN